MDLIIFLVLVYFSYEGTDLEMKQLHDNKFVNSLAEVYSYESAKCHLKS